MSMKNQTECHQSVSILSVKFNQAYVSSALSRINLIPPGEIYRLFICGILSMWFELSNRRKIHHAWTVSLYQTNTEIYSSNITFFWKLYIVDQNIETGRCSNAITNTIHIAISSMPIDVIVISIIVIIRVIFITIIILSRRYLAG